ncbi:MAG: ABC transporter ATP-binding protein [Chitinophagaceae bacterium]
MRNLRRILRYLSAYKSSLALYFLLSVLSAASAVMSIGLLLPILNVLFLPQGGSTGHSFNDKLLAAAQYVAHSKDTMSILGIICLVIVLFTVLKNLFSFLAISILLPVRHAIVRKMRNDMFEKLLALPIGYFTEEKKGDLMSRMTYDVNEVQTSVMSVMEVVMREPVLIIFYLTSMVFISPQLSLFLLIFLPVAGLAIGRIGSSLRRYARTMSEQMSDINSVLDETLSGIRVVKAFNAEKWQYLRFLKLNNENYRLRNKSASRQELASPLSETMGVIVVAIILWFGGRLVLRDHTLEPGMFITYIALFTQIINPVKNLSSALNQVQKGSAAIARMEEVLTVENAITDVPNALPIHAFKEKIELKKVTFSYGNKVILQDINLTIEKGKTVALVGASGAGKSTLADLIPRFHDVSSGEILIDGKNIKSLKLDDLRRLIGVVSQEPILFNDTLYNNITLGTGGATKERVIEAAKVAHADGFISSKALGYESIAGDRGARLSGGERQRITIARAVLKNPPILILDEATSSLDTESERIVQEAIVNLMKDRTSVVIAHRLSTVQNADEIVVLQEGKIKERGTHASLLEAKGIYYNLVAMQQVK